MTNQQQQQNSQSFFPSQTQINALALTSHSFFNCCGLAFTSFTSPPWLCQRKPVTSRPSAESGIHFNRSHSYQGEALLTTFFLPEILWCCSLSRFFNLTMQTIFLFLFTNQLIPRNNKTIYQTMFVYKRTVDFVDTLSYLFSLLNTFLNFSQVFNICNFFLQVMKILSLISTLTPFVSCLIALARLCRIILKQRGIYSTFNGCVYFFIYYC